MVRCVPPRCFQFRREAHDIQRLRSRVRRRANFARQPIFDGPDQSRDLARRPQDRVDQISGGGLAVGAGDAGEAHAFIGLLVEISRGDRQRLAAVLHFESTAPANASRRAAVSLTTRTAHPRASASCANWRPSTRAPAKRKKHKCPSPLAANRIRGPPLSSSANLPASAPRSARPPGPRPSHARAMRRHRPSTCKLHVHAAAGREHGSGRRILAARQSVSRAPPPATRGRRFLQHRAQRLPAKIRAPSARSRLARLKKAAGPETSRRKSAGAAQLPKQTKPPEPAAE